MSDIFAFFGFPAETATFMLMICMAYFFAVHSPTLLALLVVLRQRKTMRRRILFMGTVMGATYGLVVVFALAICVPIEAFAIFILPTIKHQGYNANTPFWILVEWASNWWWALLPLVILIPAIFISRYFAARWNAIVEALNGST